MPAPEPVWNRETLRAPHAQPDKAERVQAMFDAIAPTYERVNKIASLGGDARWRRRAVTAADVHAGDVVVDVCCGTGDMVRAFAAHAPAPALVIGVDFAAQMLAHGQFAGLPAPVQLVRGDALRLPLADGCADVLSCVFGVRNFRDLRAGLAELHRVARPGARVVILEFALPEAPLRRWLYRTYCERVLPALGRRLSGERAGAYQYLASSIRTFPPVATLVDELKHVGFAPVTVQRMNLGGVALYRALRTA